MSDCLGARQQQAGLQTELDRPTVTRLYDDQLELIREIKAASDKSVGLVGELRAHRKAMKNSTKRSGAVPDVD